MSVDVGAFSVNDTNRNSYSHSFDNWSVRLRAYNPYPPPALIAQGLEHSRIIFLSGFNPPFLKIYVFILKRETECVCE